jgi:hypothetical protein
MILAGHHGRAALFFMHIALRISTIINVGNKGFRFTRKDQSGYYYSCVRQTIDPLGLPTYILVYSTFSAFS